MMYAAYTGSDDICMYLSLRADNIDIEDSRTGENVFSIYLRKNDLKRMRQLQ